MEGRLEARRTWHSFRICWKVPSCTAAMSHGCRLQEEERMSDYEDEEAVEGNSDNRMGSSSRGLPPGPTPLPVPGQGDIERQRDLQEALLLQMDMQKRLHEQLEVRHLSKIQCGSD